MDEPLRNVSKMNFTAHPNDDGTWSWEQIKSSAFIRIAEATEAMAKNYNDLLRDRDYYKNRAEDEERRNRHLRGSNASLRGVITRMENRARRA